MVYIANTQALIYNRKARLKELIPTRRTKVTSNKFVYIRHKFITPNANAKAFNSNAGKFSHSKYKFIQLDNDEVFKKTTDANVFNSNAGEFSNSKYNIYKIIQPNDVFITPNANAKVFNSNAGKFSQSK